MAIKPRAGRADHAVMSRYEVEWINPENANYLFRCFTSRDDAYVCLAEIPLSSFPVLRDRLEHAILEPKSTQMECGAPLRAHD
jgi:hypothetical protein